MEQQKRELPADATLADMMSVCDGLAAQGLIVHIEYKNKQITVYGEDVPIIVHIEYNRAKKQIIVYGEDRQD